MIDRVVGFSQIGAKSGWHAAEQTATCVQAAQRGYPRQFADAQQPQENQIAAIRSVVAQGVDAILPDPQVDSDPSPYPTAVGTDIVRKSKVAGRWLVKGAGDHHCRMVILQGTGSSPAIDRKKGCERAVAKYDNLEVTRSHISDLTRSPGKEVMESFLQAENGGRDICAAYKEDMAVGKYERSKALGS